MQDLISWHKRGIDRVSVTILGDDTPFDVHSMVANGSADLDIESLGPETIEYDEDEPENWLLAQDLTALSRRGAERVSITVLPNAGGEESNVHRLKREDVPGTPAADIEAANIETDALGPIPYREDEPELWLLQQDLLALYRQVVTAPATVHCHWLHGCGVECC